MRAILSIAAAVSALALAACGSTGPSSKTANPLNDPKEALTVADAARNSGDYAAAIKLYRKALDRGDSFEARMGLGYSLAGVNQLDQAEEEFKAAEHVAPNRAEPELAIGRLDLARHRPAEALIGFDAALILAPDSAAGWNGKGIALDMTERHADAQECYRKGLAIAPNDHVLINNYGLSLALSGNYAEAVKQLTALAQEPNATARNRQNLALALGLQGDVADARTVARTDLDEPSVTNNLRFYEAARQVPIPKETAAAVLPQLPATPLLAPLTATPDSAPAADAGKPAVAADQAAPAAAAAPPPATDTSPAAPPPAAAASASSPEPAAPSPAATPAAPEPAAPSPAATPAAAAPADASGAASPPADTQATVAQSPPVSLKPE